MARRREKKQSKNSRASRGGWTPKLKLPAGWFAAPSRTTVHAVMVAIAWLIFLGGLATAWVKGVPQLQALAAKQRRVSSHDVVVQFANQPVWVKGDLADTLMRTAQTNIGGDPLVRDDLIAVRENLLSTGWFDAIDQVRRVDEDLVEVTAQFVKPYTIIRDDHGDHLVDFDGKLLPKSYNPGARRAFHFVAISGVRFARPSSPGVQWEGTDVIAGIRLMRLIDTQRWRDQIAEIDVSGYLNDEPIKLRTTKGCTIVWGGAPGEEPALEIFADEKIARLNYLNQRYGRVDANQTNELDITGERAVVMR